MNLKPELQNRLEELWISRWNQREEEVLLRLPEIQAELQLSNWEPEALLQKAQELPSSQEILKLTLQTLLVKNSLLRLKGQIEKCDKNLTTLSEIWSESCGISNFYLELEKGLNQFVLGHTSQALEHFLLAKNLAKSVHEKGLAISNTLWCLENLGISSQLTENELEKLIASQDWDLRTCGQITGQWEAFLQRKYFRQGDLEKNQLPLNHSKGLDQAKYTQMWVNALPYNAYAANSNNSESLANELHQSQFKYATTYFFRTLHGLSNLEDERQGRLTFTVDRLYLWVWRWMKDPSQDLSDKIKRLIERISQPELRNAFTLEDRCLAVNALSWVCLFDPALKAFIQPLIRDLSPSESEWPLLLGFENLFIQLFIAKNAHQNSQINDLKTLIEIHPLYSNQNILFAKWMEEKSGPKALTELWKLSSENQLSRLLEVNLLTYEIKKANQFNIRSESLAKATALLAKEGSIPVDAFAHQVFGLRNYDSTIHYTKIANLLSRLRQIMPTQINFGIRSGAVFGNGDWSQIKISNTNHLAECFRSGQRPMQKPSLSKDSKGQILTLNPRLLNLSEFGRHDVQKYFKLSRSGATRIIRQWVNQGRIIKCGSARAVRYQIQDQVGAAL